MALPTHPAQHSSPSSTFTRTIGALTKSIDIVTVWTGKLLSWLTLTMTLTVVSVVILRFLFSIGSIGAQESVTYMHATVFLLCMAYTARENGHVRVDILYCKASVVQRAWVNALGAILFMLPFALFLTFISWGMVSQSWEIKEVSSNPGGIPAIFILKSLIPACGILMALHAISEILRNLLTLSYANSPNEGEQV